jgi:RES domain-containing protein
LIVFRLAKAAFAALDGEGARLYGGRWNSPGRPMVYAAATPSLAVLEVLVHLDLPTELMPDDYQLIGIDIPDGSAVEALAETPPEAAECRVIGDDFLSRSAALALVVPSVVVPQERNALINVRHPQMAGVRIVSQEPFKFDPRLAGSQ